VSNYSFQSSNNATHLVAIPKQTAAGAFPQTVLLAAGVANPLATGTNQLRLNFVAHFEQIIKWKWNNLAR
jgi:hypothetical protein